MTNQIVIANQKGGIGKSTSAIAIGSALSKLGHRTLLIDLDPQGGLSANIGVDSFLVGRSINALLLDDNVPVESLIRSVGPNLSLIPAAYELSSAEVKLATRKDRSIRLKTRLNAGDLPYDYIIYDTPPTLGILTANAMIAANTLLIPVQCQYLAMRGVRGVHEMMLKIQNSINPDLKLLGLFGTMYHAGSTQSQEVVQELRQAFPDHFFDTIIPFDEHTSEAPVSGRSIIDYAPQSDAALAYLQLARELLDRGANLR